MSNVNAFWLHVFFFFFFLNVCIEDIPGKQAYKSLSPTYCRSLTVVVICFDVTNKNGLAECDEWIDLVRETGGSPVFIAVGNKIDLASERMISTEDARAHFASQSILYFETSAVNGVGVKELFRTIFDSALNANSEEKHDDDDEKRDGKKHGGCIIC